MKVQLHDCVSKHLTGGFEQDYPTDFLHEVEVVHDVPTVETYVHVAAEGVTIGERLIPPGSAERVKFSFTESSGMPRSLVVMILTHDEERTFGCDLKASVGNRANVLSTDDENFVVELVETKE